MAARQLAFNKWKYETKLPHNLENVGVCSIDLSLVTRVRFAASLGHQNFFSWHLCNFGKQKNICWFYCTCFNSCEVVYCVLFCFVFEELTRIHPYASTPGDMIMLPNYFVERLLFIIFTKSLNYSSSVLHHNPYHCNINYKMINKKKKSFVKSTKPSDAKVPLSCFLWSQRGHVFTGLSRGQTTLLIAAAFSVPAQGGSSLEMWAPPERSRGQRRSGAYLRNPMTQL